MATPSRNPSQAPWLELRAHGITDPVERLRYLRREMSALEKKRWWQVRLSQRGWMYAVGMVMLAAFAAWPTRTTEASVPRQKILFPIAAGASNPLPKVWQVDHSAALETYSNGLRIDLTSQVSNRPRGRYPVFGLMGESRPVRYNDGPAGIVYHTTESLLAPFEEQQNHRLKKLGENLLEWIKQQRSYHYVIDRFGRVYRVVPESDAANHAGYSVWADSTGEYVNLNNSFLAVAFEAQTGAAEQVTAAQIVSARLLTEMLRSRYSIAPEDCVTHAQVSVNPDNMYIGAHTDWASAFPFAAMGLPDNYAAPLASLYAFGFEYDGSFLRATGERWKGLDLAASHVASEAGAARIPVARYRAQLQHRYKDILNSMEDWEVQAGDEHALQKRTEGGG